MRTYSFLLFLGLFVFCTPFLGIPESWKAILLFLLGAGVILTALVYRFSDRKKESVKHDEYFTESQPAVHAVGE